MRVVRGIAVNLLWLLQGVSLVLLLGVQAEIPWFLQPLGRMHPLVLHFPIVFVLLLALLFRFRESAGKEIARLLPDFLLFTALLTAFTTVMGFFLFSEGGYEGQTIEVHKWTGMALSFILFLAYLLRERKKAAAALTYVSILLVVITGHMGASLTHGEDFLIEPVLARFRAAPEVDKSVYELAIQGIIDRKCSSCHNPGKKKGGLSLVSVENMMAGGDLGPAIDTTDFTKSPLLGAIMLPLEDKYHMPPKDKPQLSAVELAILRHWVLGGGDGEKKLSQLDTNDSLVFLLSGYSRPVVKEERSFDAADPADITRLNTPFRTVLQLSPEDPALQVSIHVSKAWGSHQLEELEPVAEQITSLDLSHLPFSDGETVLLDRFPNLEELRLNFTKITGAGVRRLATLSSLRKLGLAGIKVTSTDMESLIEQLPLLEEVYLWESGITPENVQRWTDRWPVLLVDLGYLPDEDETLVLSPPQLVNTSNVLSRTDSIALQHKLPGVEIRYTIDGREPDSLSALYERPLSASSVTQLKVKAFKSGWRPSEAVEHGFFIKGYLPVKIDLISSPDVKYKGTGARGLTDGVKGEAENFISPAWMGYRDGPFDARIDFGENPPVIGNLVIGYALNMGAYIMKPVKVEVYGGENPSSMKLLATLKTDLPKNYEPNGELAYNVPLGSENYRFYRVKAWPWEQLPDWHVGAGDKGWVFVDELFFY